MALSNHGGGRSDRALYTKERHDCNCGHKGADRSSRFRGDCNYCGITGHKEANCRRKQGGERLGRNRRRNPERKETANVATEEDLAFFVDEALLARASRDRWIFDTGATASMTWDKSEMTNYKKILGKRTVRVGDERLIPVLGSGTVTFEIATLGGQRVRQHRKVLHVPALGAKLMSWHQLKRNGAKLADNGEALVITLRDGTKLYCDERDRVFTVRAGVRRPASSRGQTILSSAVGHGPDAVCLSRDEGTEASPAFGNAKFAGETPTALKEESKAAAKGETMTSVKQLSHVDTQELALRVHRRAAHVNLGYLKLHVAHKELQATPEEKKAMASVKKLECEACMIGKSVEKPLPKKSRTRASRMGGTVSVDLCGPFPRSKGGRQYALGLLDDCSRYLFTKYLTTKGGAVVLQEIKKVDAVVLRLTGRHIGVPRADFGKEFDNGNLREYCDTHGIEQQFSTPHKHGQSGRIEREWRTLQEATKTVLEDSGLSKSFWAEAMDYVTTVRNYIRRVRQVQGSPEANAWRSPAKLFLGNKFRSRLPKPFGCLVLAVIPDQAWAEGQTRCVPGICT